MIIMMMMTMLTMDIECVRSRARLIDLPKGRPSFAFLACGFPARKLLGLLALDQDSHARLFSMLLFRELIVRGPGHEARLGDVWCWLFFCTFSMIAVRRSVSSWGELSSNPILQFNPNQNHSSGNNGRKTKSYKCNADKIRIHKHHTNHSLSKSESRHYDNH